MGTAEVAERVELAGLDGGKDVLGLTAIDFGLVVEIDIRCGDCLQPDAGGAEVKACAGFLLDHRPRR